MKLRHTAALALVGWYLMMPPLVEKPVPHDPSLTMKENDDALVDTRAPLSKWMNLRSFDFAPQCYAAINQLTKDLEQGR